MIIKGIPDWAVYIAGAGVGLFVLYKIAMISGTLGYDVATIIDACPVCKQGNNNYYNSPACQSCMDVAAKKVPRPF